MTETFPLTVRVSCRAKGLDYEETVFVKSLEQKDKYLLIEAAENLLWNTVAIEHG